jgi:ligand-binding SRPBCC domain-containing protein
MRFSIATTVQGTPQSVFTRFTEELFRVLAPPFPRVEVVRFDGCAVGDIVQVELHFLLFSTKWTSTIIEQYATEQEIVFVDQGTALPFFLSAWRHTHIIRRIDATRSAIIDSIAFEVYNPMITLLMFPLIITQFLYRKPIYKRYFR